MGTEAPVPTAAEMAAGTAAPAAANQAARAVEHSNRQSDRAACCGQAQGARG